MATSYTSKLQLPRWGYDDDVRMEDFNKIGTELESRLGYLKKTLLYQATPNYYTANTIDAPLSSINWSLYNYVDVEFMLKAKTTQFTFKGVMSPLATSLQKGTSSSGTNFTSKILECYTDIPARARIYSLYSADRNLNVETISHEKYLSTSAYPSDPTDYLTTNCQKISFTPVTSNSTNYFTNGGYVKIWGIG